MDEDQVEIFKTIVNNLYANDENCAIDGQDFDIDLQGKSHHHYDNARRPFFSFVNEELFERPTYKSFLALLDNYTSEVGESDTVSYLERQENINFINDICDTTLMQTFYQDLMDHEIISFDYNQFKRNLYDTWFRLY